VGVDRHRKSQEGQHPSIPHGCGGGPSPEIAGRAASEYSPRVWGWTAFTRPKVDSNDVFPTGVGVDRNGNCQNFRVQKYSPRVWGWTVYEGRPLGIAIQVEIPNHLKLLWSKATVVSVKEKARPDLVRWVLWRRTQENR